MTLPAGTIIDRYRIESPIGRGGMGQVFRAFDLRLRRPAALKILHEALSPEGMTRLVREARLAAALRHPNIVSVYDVGESDGIAYLAMELLEGRTLREVAREGASVADKVRWLADVARGLEAAHEAGLVHRDVKPQNALVAGGVAKIVDFGLATDLDAEARRRTALLPSLRTQPGYSMGTPHYMAPEILLGDRAADACTDQFAWGVTAYEVLVGPLPRRRDLEPGGRWTAPTVAAPGVSARLAGVVMRALDGDRASRFPTMRELADALDGALAPLPPTLHDAAPATAPEPVPESEPDGRGAAMATRMFAARTPAPSGPAAAPRPATVREPKAAVLAPLVEAALGVLAREVPGGFGQAVVIVTLDVEGARARFFVQLVATDAAGELWVPEASAGLGRTAAGVIAADARDGNGRWTRLVLRLLRESREAIVLSVA